MPLVLFAVFVASGFAGLIYESIWTHYLKLFLGHAAYAQTLVLALFMGGMTLGAWAAGRRASRWPNLLLGYALAEAAIGICALGFHEAFQAVTAYGYDAMQAAQSPAVATALKWGLSAALILPQSVLMGATFPLMSGALLRRMPGRAGNAVALLYFGNSFGGAAGVLVSGFVLLEALGLDGTMRLAGACNLAIALVAALLARAGEVPMPVGERRAGRWSGLDRLLIGAALFTGLASFVYEIAWIRMLSMVLGASSHAFELMLAAFIVGLALGSLWIHRIIDRLRDPVLVLAGVQVAMGLFAASTVVTYGYTFQAMAALMAAVEKSGAGYALYNLGSFGLVLAVMLPATVCAGMTLPLLSLLLVRRGHGEASTGAVYAANTAGAILGVGLAVHVGLPLVGLKGLLLAGCAVDILVGLALLASRGGGPRTLIPAGAVAAGAAVLLAALPSFDQVLMASGVFRRGTLVDADRSQVVDHRDGKTATIHLTRTATYLSIRTNGKPDASIALDRKQPATDDEVTTVLAGLLPLLYRPDATLAANIGLGAGLTTHVLLSTPQLERVDTLEIEQAMVDLAQAFRPVNERVYSDPRSRIHIDDAKTYFAASNTVYDIIVSEPSNPWVSGVSGLFSKEFYRQAKRHLKPGGVLVQWVQLYEIAPSLVASVFNALEEEFGDYVVYAPNIGDILIVATLGPELGAIDQTAFHDADIAAAARRAGILNPGDLSVRRLGSRRELEPVFDSYSTAVNSDYRPVLDLGAARSRFLRENAVALIDLKRLWLPVGEMVGEPGPPPPAAVTPFPRYPVTRPYYLAALVRDRAEGRPLPKLPLAQELAEDVEQVLGLCRAAPVGSRVPALLGLATATLPYLSPLHAERFWLGLRERPCGTALSPADQVWFDLFLAVARRDGDAMAANADALLARGEGMVVNRRAYLVAAAMLGHLARNDAAAALAVWEAAGDDLPAQERSAMTFRLLLAHARALS